MKNTMKKKIMDAICERAYELESHFWENKDLYFGSGKVDAVKVQEAALKKAVQEWHENKAVFSIDIKKYGI